MGARAKVSGKTERCVVCEPAHAPLVFFYFLA